MSCPSPALWYCVLPVQRPHTQTLPFHIALTCTLPFNMRPPAFILPRSALIFGAIFFRIKRSQSSIQDRMGLLQVRGRGLWLGQPVVNPGPYGAATGEGEGGGGRLGHGSEEV